MSRKQQADAIKKSIKRNKRHDRRTVKCKLRIKYIKGNNYEL